MLKAIIHKANITIAKHSDYSIQIVLDLFLYYDFLDPLGGETIDFDITPSSARDLANLLSKYNDQYILFFDSSQWKRYNIRWSSPKTVVLGVGDCRGLQYKKYQFGSGCAAELSALINRVIGRSIDQEHHVSISVDGDTQESDAKIKKRTDDNLRSVFG